MISLGRRLIWGMGFIAHIQQINGKLPQEVNSVRPGVIGLAFASFAPFVSKISGDFYFPQACLVGKRIKGP